MNDHFVCSSTSVSATEGRHLGDLTGGCGRAEI